MSGEFKPVNADTTFDFDWKLGEVNPKERTVALRHVKRQRERGMPKELDAYDVGLTIHVNGRHAAHFGVTAGVPKGKHIPRNELLVIAARLLLPYLDPENKPQDFDDNERFVLFGRDNI